MRWVKHLYGLVDELNNTQTEMIGMKPKDAIVLDQVPLVNREAYPPEEVLPEDGLYQYLLQPGEEHDDRRRRVTDRIWSKGTYRLREIIEDAGNHVMYHLSDGPESALGHLRLGSSGPMAPAGEALLSGPWRAFVSEELMLIPEDTKLPPDYIQEW